MSREDDQIYQMDVRWICAKWKVQPAQLVHVSSWQFNITKCHQFYSFFGIRVPTAWDAEAPILPQFPVGAAAWACRERGGDIQLLCYIKKHEYFFFKKIIFRCINMIQYVDIWLIFGCLGANYCDIYIYQILWVMSAMRLHRHGPQRSDGDTGKIFMRKEWDRLPSGYLT